MEYNSFFEQSCRQIGDKNLFSILSIDGHTQEPSINSITGNNFYQEVRRLSQSLQLSDLCGKKIFFFSENSIDLLSAFFASLNLNCHSSIADTKLTPSELNQIVDTFEPDFIIAEKSKLPICQSLKLIQNHKAILLDLNDLKNVPETLKSISSPINSPENSSQNKSSAKIIVFTSGTSGTPKGVVLSIESIVFEALSLKESFVRDYTKRRCFSILPLNHIYGITTAIFISLWTDQEVFLTQSLAPQHLRIILQEKKPFYLYVVPQFLAIIKNRVIDAIEKKSPMKRLIAKSFLHLNSKLKSKLIAKILFKEIRQQIGESLDFIISGGAPLRADIFNFFEAIGIPICNGYGLTETGPVVCMNTLQYRKINSVGKAIAGVEVKVNDETSELLVKGPNVFEGYYNNKELTLEQFDSQGWFKTGDLGSIDSSGFIYIQGRSKSMIVLSSGKKVQPEEIENHFNKLSYIKNCCYIYKMDKNSTLSKLTLIIELDPQSSLANDKKELMTQLILHSNELAPFKRPQSFKFSKEPLPITTTLKVRRFLVEKNIEHYED